MRQEERGGAAQEGAEFIPPGLHEGEEREESIGDVISPNYLNVIAGKTLMRWTGHYIVPTTPS